MLKSLEHSSDPYELKQITVKTKNWSGTNDCRFDLLISSMQTFETGDSSMDVNQITIPHVSVAFQCTGGTICSCLDVLPCLPLTWELSVKSLQYQND